MPVGRLAGRFIIAAVMLVAGGSRSVAAGLIVDGDFAATGSSMALRADNKGQDWGESRNDTKAGHRLLFLSKKSVAGNVTPKALIKANPDLNTYLSQRFTTPQTGEFTVRYDILVREILPDDNHSAFFMVGNDSDKKGGPNSTGAERFVFVGFENATEKGKINLFARGGSGGWEKRTIVAPNLDLGKWYTIEVVVYPSDALYAVSVKGVTQPVEVEAFKAGKKPPKKLTHLSFSSWNDGAGTFYIDNVSAESK
jgi:hypothetical protein